MTDSQSAFHKEADPEDPMEINAQSCGGDPMYMVDGIVEEYARMGWDAEAIMRLFEDPYYSMTYGLGELFTLEIIRDRVKMILDRTGVFRVKVSETSSAPINGGEEDV